MPGLSQAVGFGLEATASGEPDSDREDTGTEHHSRLTPVEGLTAERGRAFCRGVQSNDGIMGSNALVFSRDLSFIPNKTN